MKIPGRFRIPLTLVAISISLSLVLAASLQNGATYRYLNVFHEVWSYTRSNYVEPVDENALLDGAFRGMAGSLDGASAYLAPGEEKVLQAPIGPGRPGMETLPSGGGPVVVRVDPNGPAARAGIEVGDQVWKIAGKSARQQSWPQAKRRLSGPVGGHLDLTILDGRTFKLRDVRLDLDAAHGPGYVIDRRGPAVYVRVFDPDVVDGRALNRDLSQRLAQDGDSPLLVDLRGTVGLDRDGMARVAGALFPGKPLLRFTPRSGSDETVDAPLGVAVPLNRPVFALVDATTAGTGEAVAALLKERAGATLCGRSTYGLGALPELIPLTHGGNLLLTTREIRTPGGLHWSDKGLEPDKVLAPPQSRAGSDDDKDKDPLLDEALKFVAEKAPRLRQTG